MRHYLQRALDCSRRAVYEAACGVLLLLVGVALAYHFHPAKSWGLGIGVLLILWAILALWSARIYRAEARRYRHLSTLHPVKS